MAAIGRSEIARADVAEVEALIAKGNDLRRAGTPGPALPYFQKAYELARTPRTTAQLGLGELAAGYPVEAADHLEAALQSPKDPSILKYRQMLADALAMARSQIGELTIKGDPAGAEIAIDGRAVGVLPLASPLKLPARKVEVVLRAPGYEARRELVVIAGGQSHVLTLNLDRIKKAAAEAPRLTIEADSPVARTAPLTARGGGIDKGRTEQGFIPLLHTAAWIAGGAAVAAATGGLALNLAARSKSSDFNRSCRNGPMGVMPLEGATLAECEDHANAWRSYRRWSLLGYVSAATLAVTSGVFFAVSRPGSPATDSRAHFACAPAIIGLSCQGLFR
jgi:hypothetical protein